MLGVDRLATNGANVGLSARTRDRLVAITVLLGILTVVHDLDHVRQGRGLPLELYVVAVAALVSIATTLVVLVRSPAWSKTVAAAQGVATVVGAGASTLLRNGQTSQTPTPQPAPTHCLGSSSWP